MRDLRALPDFSRSPTSSGQLQNLLPPKRCRPKHRERAAPRPLCSPLPRSPGSPSQCNLESCRPHKSVCPRALCVSPSRSHQRPDEVQRSPAGDGDYMLMSPKRSVSSPLPQDEYMFMSPLKPDWQAGFFSQTPFTR